MTPSTNTRPDDLYQGIRANLEKAGIRAGPPRTIAYGFQFRVETDAWSALLRVYLKKSGAVTIDYSQVRNARAEGELRTAIDGSGRPSPPAEKRRTDDDPATLPTLIGSDESGKGDYFGPLVVAAVCLDREGAARLRAAGVTDCKALSDQENRALAPRIEREAVATVVRALLPPEYNDRYEATARAGGTLNDLLASLHAEAIGAVVKMSGCQTALVDQFAGERVLQDRLATRCPGLMVIQRPRAEQVTAVAAASVLARARFLLEMDRLGEAYHLHLQKGAAAGVTRQAAHLVGQNGPGVLRSVAKVHFRTTGRVCRGERRDY